MQRIQEPLLAGLTALALATAAHAYASEVCTPPFEAGRLELISVTEDGAPVSDLSAYAGLQVDIVAAGGPHIRAWRPQKDGTSLSIGAEVYHAK